MFELRDGQRDQPEMHDHKRGGENGSVFHFILRSCKTLSTSRIAAHNTGATAADIMAAVISIILWLDHQAALVLGALFGRAAVAGLPFVDRGPDAGPSADHHADRDCC